MSARTSVPRLRVAVFLVASILVAGPVVAQTPAERETAIGLIAEGAKLYDAGKFAEALAKFEVAYKVVPSQKIRFNMALALSGLNRDAEAAENYRAFLNDVPGAPADARATATAALAKLDKTLGTIEIAAEPAGTQIAVRGRPVGTAPLAASVFVSPGVVEVIGAKAGFEPRREVVTVAAGKKLRLELRLMAPPAVITEAKPAELPARPAAVPSPATARPAPATLLEQPAPAPAASGSRTGKILGGVALGAGALLTVAGVVVRSRAVNSYEEGKQLGCPGKPRCDDLAETVDSRVTVGKILFDAAAVANVVGRSLLIINWSKSESGAAQAMVGLSGRFQ
jgi:hypothetical protein